MTKKRQKGLISWGRLLTVVVLSLAVFLAIDLGRRALDTYYLNRRVSALEEEVATAKAENQALKERLEYVGTDSYVEEAAREKLGWTKSGEIAIVPLEVEAPSQPEASQASAESKPNWQKWLELFFGP